MFSTFGKVTFVKLIAKCLATNVFVRLIGFVVRLLGNGNLATTVVDDNVLGRLDDQNAVVKVGGELIRVHVRTNRKALIKACFGNAVFGFDLALARNVQDMSMLLQVDMDIAKANSLGNGHGNLVRLAVFLDFVAGRRSQQARHASAGGLVDVVKESALQDRHGLVEKVPFPVRCKEGVMAKHIKAHPGREPSSCWCSSQTLSWLFRLLAHHGLQFGIIADRLGGAVLFHRDATIRFGLHFGR
jgi:hypothetical protein